MNFRNPFAQRRRRQIKKQGAWFDQRVVNDRDTLPLSMQCVPDDYLEVSEAYTTGQSDTVGALSMPMAKRYPDTGDWRAAAVAYTSLEGTGSVYQIHGAWSFPIVRIVRGKRELLVDTMAQSVSLAAQLVLMAIQLDENGYIQAVFDVVNKTNARLPLSDLCPTLSLSLVQPDNTLFLDSQGHVEEVTPMYEPVWIRPRCWERRVVTFPVPVDLTQARTLPRTVEPRVDEAAQVYLQPTGFNLLRLRFGAAYAPIVEVDCTAFVTVEQVVKKEAWQ